VVMSSKCQRVLFAILWRVARKNDGAAIHVSADARLTIVVQTARTAAGLGLRHTETGLRCLIQQCV
jgi:hypothetical protein